MQEWMCHLQSKFGKPEINSSSSLALKMLIKSRLTMSWNPPRKASTCSLTLPYILWKVNFYTYSVLFRFVTGVFSPFSMSAISS